MKLLFDENLSPALLTELDELYPHSAHVRDVELKSASDQAVWEYAAQMAYGIITKDADFRQRSFLYGPPPKVIHVRLGNCSTRQIAELLRTQAFQIECFAALPEAGFRERLGNRGTNGTFAALRRKADFCVPALCKNREDAAF